MLFNKILGKIIKICILENFSKFEVKFASYYITPVHSGVVFSNGNMGLKCIYTRILKNNKRNKQQKKTHTHTTANIFTITSFK